MVRYFAAVAVAFVSAAAGVAEESERPATKTANPLEGSWRLVTFKGQPDPGVVWRFADDQFSSTKNGGSYVPKHRLVVEGAALGTIATKSGVTAHYELSEDGRTLVVKSRRYPHKYEWVLEKADADSPLP